MPIQHIQIANEAGGVFSPYTGKPAFINDEINDDDPSLVFFYSGDAGAYLFPRDESTIDEDKEPSELTEGIDLIVTIDAGRSGLNQIGYRSPDQ